MVIGRQSCSELTVNASTAATNQPQVMATMTGHGASSAAGSAGGCEGSSALTPLNVVDRRPGPETHSVVSTL